MNEEALKNLPRTVIDYEVVNAPEPLEAEGNLVLEANAAHSRVKALGHIIVEGAAEHCVLESEQGSVFLESGSMAYTAITAAKNIYVKYADNATLTAGNDVIVEKSLLLSQVEAARRVVSETEGAEIVGGRTQAGEQVYVHAIGNPNGVETLVVVTSSAGEIIFSRAYPGARFEIGGVAGTVSERVDDGIAVLRDGEIHIRTGG